MSGKPRCSITTMILIHVAQCTPLSTQYISLTKLQMPVVILKISKHTSKCIRLSFKVLFTSSIDCAVILRSQLTASIHKELLAQQEGMDNS